MEKLVGRLGSQAGQALHKCDLTVDKPAPSRRRDLPRLADHQLHQGRRPGASNTMPAARRMR